MLSTSLSSLPSEWPPVNLRFSRCFIFPGSFHPTPTFPRLFLKSCLLQKMFSLSRIHGTGIFTYIYIIDVYGFHVGKYNSPMDPMGLNAHIYQCFLAESFGLHDFGRPPGLRKNNTYTTRTTCTDPGLK